VITTAEVALAAPAIAVIGTLAGAWGQSRRDERRWERDRQLEAVRWTREDRQRWADRRFAVYSDFLNLTRSWIEVFDDYQDRIAEDWLLLAMPECTQVANAADEALSGLELLSSPATRQAAEATRAAILKIAAAATQIHHVTGDLDEDRRRPPTDDELNELSQLIADARRHRGAYIELVQEELGTNA
jgi:Ni/Co efflux regulator RcnB